ncbi:NAD-dependent dihydropyrimidine dehydrogenase subunit PreA [Escherichia coli]|nr:NAD-dependent dihydropyrimidine dehydrogenase subunit PreA [Escherichia coli]
MDELTPAFTPLLAIKEASRCLLCHDAPCSQACPAQTDPGKFIRSIYFRNFKGAAETIRENNALGAVCARVCPTEKLCQSGCTRAGVDAPIDIGRLQRFVTDFEQQTGMEIYQPGTKTLGKVAIIGAGPAGLQASVTLTNQGYDVTIYEKEAQPGGWLRNGIPQFRYPDKVLIASIMGENEQQWEELARLVQEAGADMIECNFSCPQMTSHAMGSDVGQSPELVEKYCRAVKRGSTLPMLAKMTPNIGDMCEVALAAKRGGADGIAAINTVKSITNIDLNQKIGMPIVNGKSSISGYSGKAVKPIALRFIQQMRTHPELRDFPISGIGGIETWEDAAEFLLLGAATLQVTTGIMQYGYRIVEDMASGLSHYLADQGFDSLQEMVGLANNNIVPAEDLDRSYIVYPRINLDKCVGCGRCYISCYDGGHQAMEWSEKTRTPHCNTEKCVGCLLCGHVCPVGCIELGEVKFKKGEKEHPVTL